MNLIMPGFLLETKTYVFEIEDNSMLACWKESIQIESEGFMNSIRTLMQLIIEHKVTKLLLYSSSPLEGTLTLEAFHIFEEAAFNVHLKKIALIESADYLWDNNILQTLEIIKAGAGLLTEIEIHKNKEAALEWLNEK